MIRAARRANGSATFSEGTQVVSDGMEELLQPERSAVADAHPAGLDKKETARSAVETYLSLSISLSFLIEIGAVGIGILHRNGKRYRSTHL